jgi:hypothetical protein
MLLQARPRPEALWLAVGWTFGLSYTHHHSSLIASAAPAPAHTHTHTYTLSSACFPFGPEHQGLSLFYTAATCTICGLGSTHTGLPFSHTESLDCDSGHKQWQISGCCPARWGSYPASPATNPGPLTKKKKKRN